MVRRSQGLLLPLPPGLQAQVSAEVLRPDVHPLHPGKDAPSWVGLPRAVHRRGGGYRIGQSGWDWCVGEKGFPCVADGVGYFQQGGLCGPYLPQHERVGVGVEESNVSGVQLLTQVSALRKLENRHRRLISEIRQERTWSRLQRQLCWGSLTVYITGSILTKRTPQIPAQGQKKKNGSVVFKSDLCF